MSFYALGAIDFLVGVTHAALPLESNQPAVADSGYMEQVRDDISPAQEQAMWNEIRRNVAMLREQGLLATADVTSAAQAVTYTFPLRTAPGLPDYAGFRVSAFVDHNAAAVQVLDYNGGSRTYDGHHGTDYALWPFSWNKVNAGEVQAVAAAAGTIAYRANVDPTDHNPCDGGSNNDAWNYVALVHADGRLTIYGHMRYNSLTTKSIGKTVAQGEYLGTAASSGNSSGPHLHFEMRYGSFSNAEWIDPYAGPNSQSLSLWANQRPYIDSAINKISTHSAQPIDTPCQPSTTNLQDSFSTPSRIRFYIHYRDYQGALSTEGRIYRPDGTVFQSWSGTDATTFLSAAKKSWAFDFSASDPAGTWRFEATYNGQTYETFFNLDSPTSITVLSPSSESRLDPRNSHTITWTGNLGGEVNITLYRNGVHQATVANNVPSHGQYRWTPDATLAQGAGYSIRVSSVVNPAVYGESDKTFSLKAAPSLTPILMLLLE
jgi:murein DD-endopeptidase MepM/ murein hydrolase activator NlpD